MIDLLNFFIQIYVNIHQSLQSSFVELPFEKYISKPISNFLFNQWIILNEIHALRHWNELSERNDKYQQCLKKD